MSAAISGSGNARVTRAGERVLAITDFSWELSSSAANEFQRKVRFGATPKPARETRALPGSFAPTLQRFNALTNR
jgi:hypothetical protein